MTVELLYFDDCPNYQTLLPHLCELIADAGLGHEVVLRRVATDNDARRMHFLGSPTVRIDGADVEPGAGERDDFGPKCRLYHTPEGIKGVPPDQLLLSALRRAAGGYVERTLGGRALHPMNCVRGRELWAAGSPTRRVQWTAAARALPRYDLLPHAPPMYAMAKVARFAPRRDGGAAR